MEEIQTAVDTSNDRKNHYSRPVFQQVLKVNSLQAQRVMERSFEQVSNSLFSIDVILRIIGEQKEIDQVETVILEHLSKVSEDLDKTTVHLNKLMENNGIDIIPGYTHPNEYTIEINSPQTACFAHLIRKMDTLMGIVDTLWLNTILTSKQRIDATYQWQQRLIKLAGRIIGIEKRARISAYTKGKEGEVEKATPKFTNADKEMADDIKKMGEEKVA